VYLVYQNLENVFPLEATITRKLGEKLKKSCFSFGSNADSQANDAKTADSI
jgi:hypothetical protein